jgi:hypothetical protein
MKSKPVLVRHWNKAGNTTVLIELYKEGTIAHNLEAEQITTNPKIRSTSLGSRFTGTEWYQCTKTDTSGKQPGLTITKSNKIRHGSAGAWPTRPEKRGRIIPILGTEAARAARWQ